MAAAGARIRVPVAVACRVLKLSTQGYYKWLKEPVSQRDWDDAHAIDALLDIHEDDPTLGSRFLTDELADLGITASENRVWLSSMTRTSALGTLIRSRSTMRRRFGRSLYVGISTTTRSFILLPFI